MTCDPDLTSPIAKFFGCNTQNALSWMFGDSENQMNLVIMLMLTLGFIIASGFYILYRNAKREHQPFWSDIDDPKNWMGGLYSAPPPILAIVSGLWAIREWFYDRTDPVWGQYWSVWYGIIPIAVCVFWISFFIIVRIKARQEKLIK